MNDIDLEQLQWGRVVKDAEIRDRVMRLIISTRASMGPRRERRGNRPTGNLPGTARGASMGPRRERRGNECYRGRRGIATRASMGPRRERRGNWGGVPAGGRRQLSFNGAAS